MRHIAVLAFAAAFLASAAIAASPDRAATQTAFRGWLEQTLWPDAKTRGITRATFERAFAGLTLQLDLPDLKLPGAPDAAPDWRQAEFRAPAGYFSERELASQVAIGRRELEKWRSTLDAIEAAYGVPRGILVAIWAKESSFGRAAIPHNAMRILATQAYLGRRPEIFRAELLAALVMIEQGHSAAGGLRSSWAGALGQPQFLPTKFLAHAVDFDGDGKRDIWNSVPDTLASIANYLQANGWRSGRDWGFEARVPDAVSCALEGPDKGQPIAAWIERGVTRVSGRPFPAHEVDQPGFLLMPAGRYGPAFIATENFYVLKTYNESDVYALFVGHLADRFAGGRSFLAPWRKIGSFTRGAVQTMQVALEAIGYNVGGADGLIGFRTRTALGDYQSRNSLAPTCFPDTALIRRIG